MLGSHNTTPCDIAAGGTTNDTLNCKSMSSTSSGNNWIGTRAVPIPTGNSTSLGPALKNNRSPEKLIHYTVYGGKHFMGKTLTVREEIGYH